MNPFRYTKYISPGQWQTVMIADTNYLDASFAASDSPSMYDILDATINTDLNDITEYYQRKRLTNVKPGTPCLVRYIDQRLYRAYILRPSSEFVGEQEVYFVDYGNVWSARPRNIFVIEQNLLDIPVAIYRCKLINADDGTPSKREMIAAYIKEMTNIERSFMVIDVIKVEDNTHFVKLFHYSMDQYFYFNDYINRLISQVIDEKGQAIDDDDATEIMSRFSSAIANEKAKRARAVNFSGKPSNYDAMSQLLLRVYQSANVHNDDDVPLVNVEIVYIVSPFEFFAVPDLKKTKAHYQRLANEMNAEVQNDTDTTFQVDVPSELLAYFDPRDKAWHRGQILKVCQAEELETLYEYSVVDYDTMESLQLHILKGNVRKYFRRLPEKYCTKPQAMHCVLPNYAIADGQPPNIAETMVEHMRNYIKLHGKNLFILPLVELSNSLNQENKFIVNLYAREMMLTGMFEANKQHFESYLTQLAERFGEKISQKRQYSIPIKFNFQDSIYRNLCSINRFDVDEDDDQFEQDTSHYIRVHYPNTQHFYGIISYFNQKRNKLCFRYEIHEDLYVQVTSRLSELVREEMQNKLDRIEKTLVELYPCVVWDSCDNLWYRCEVLTIIEQKQAPWLPKIKVRMVDSGAIAMYFIEDLRDISIEPQIPMLAVPCRVIGHGGLGAKLANSIGKKACFNWINFPNLPMNVYVDSILDEE